MLLKYQHKSGRRRAGTLSHALASAASISAIQNLALNWLEFRPEKLTLQGQAEANPVAPLPEARASNLSRHPPRKWAINVGCNKYITDYMAVIRYVSSLDPEGDEPLL
jgi:hypothetical protein